MSLLRNPKNKDPNDKTPFILRSQMQLMHDEFSECRFINLFPTKDAMVEPMCEFFALRKSLEKPIHFLQNGQSRGESSIRLSIEV